jgi:hypothetical protein
MHVCIVGLHPYIIFCSGEGKERQVNNALLIIVIGPSLFETNLHIHCRVHKMSLTHAISLFWPS